MLSKSDLQSYLQCSRKLWLEVNKPDLIDAENSLMYRRITDGIVVGNKARGQLGKDCFWPAANDDKLAGSEYAKQAFLSNSSKSAAEMPMVRNNLYARADALIKSDGKITLQETKAKVFPLKKDKTTPDNPDDHLIDDVAIQLWVMQGMGYELGGAELNLLNGQWRYPGGENYDGLFRQLDVTEAALSRLSLVDTWVKDATAILDAEMPEVVTGKQCSSPYDCPYLKFCSDREPRGEEHPIELLPDAAGKGLAKKLKEKKGYTSLLQPSPEELVGSQALLYRRVQAAHKNNQPILLEKAQEIINELPYPRYYFDFEAIDFPVPRWPGVRPYEHVPFQWSCHVEWAPGIFEHREFLDLSGDDPSIDCIKKMCDLFLPKKGPIIVYYAPYEKKRLEELAIRHPQYQTELNDFISRLFDLLPVVKENFYHPLMRGSFSIKKVLPVVAPDLRYEDLDEVQEGGAAQVAYLFAAFEPTTTADRKKDLENKLLAYCRQDTWAMVEVAYFLAQRGRPVERIN